MINLKDGQKIIDCFWKNPKFINVFIKGYLKCPKQNCRIKIEIIKDPIQALILTDGTILRKYYVIRNFWN